MGMREHLEQLGWLDHAPNAGYPRSDVTGEQVCAEQWKQLMSAEPDWDEACGLPNAKLAHILGASPYWLNQLQATLCARIICWFGSNCGRAFVQEAFDRKARMGKWSEDHFVLQWAHENRRSRGLNSGIRTLEYMACSGRVISRMGLGQVPKEGIGFLTGEHWETAEILMQWCGSEEGERFIRNCLQITEQRLWQERAERDRAWREEQGQRALQARAS